jgi:hypothetical protein
MNLNVGVAMQDVKAGGPLGRSTCVMIYLAMILSDDPDTGRTFDGMYNGLPEADQDPVIEAIKLIVGKENVLREQ